MTPKTTSSQSAGTAPAEPAGKAISPGQAPDGDQDPAAVPTGRAPGQEQYDPVSRA